MVTRSRGCWILARCRGGRAATCRSGGIAVVGVDERERISQLGRFLRQTSLYAVDSVIGQPELRKSVIGPALPTQTPDFYHDRTKSPG